MLDQTTKERSISSRALEHIQAYAPDDVEFNVQQLLTDMGLPESDKGALSGFVSRAAKSGLLKMIGLRDGAYAYKIGDRTAKIFVKSVRGKGGHPGPRKGHKQVSEPVLGPTLPEQLLNLAIALEQTARDMQDHKAVLCKVSTQELMAELARRVK